MSIQFSVVYMFVGLWDSHDESPQGLPHQSQHPPLLDVCRRVRYWVFQETGTELWHPPLN